MLIYLDSVILIYYFDHIGPFQVRAAGRLAVLQAAGDRIAVSDLVRMEYRVGPMRTGDLARFDVFFALPEVRVVPITTSAYDRATEIRARHRYKALDAIHLAAAVEAGCDLFLTHDVRLSTFPDQAVEVLP